MGQGCYWVNQQQALLVMWFKLLYDWLERNLVIFLKSSFLLCAKTPVNALKHVYLGREEYGCVDRLTLRTFINLFLLSSPVKRNGGGGGVEPTENHLLEKSVQSLPDDRLSGVYLWFG